MRQSILTVLVGISLLAIATPGLSVGQRERDETRFAPSWHRVRNVALGKTVGATGLFFVGLPGFYAQFVKFAQVVDFGTITDGNFFEDNQPFDKGSVWWQEDADDVHNSLSVYLGAPHRVKRLLIQVDNDDLYVISWVDLEQGPMELLLDTDYIGGGMNPPVAFEIDTVTDEFVIEAAAQKDKLFSVSEFQAFGWRYSPAGAP